MFGIVNYTMFFTSCLILHITPGSDTMYILGKSMSKDKKTGVVSVLGPPVPESRYCGCRADSGTSMPGWYWMP